MTRRTELQTIAAVAQLLGVLLVVSGLYFGRDVLIPLALAILLSFLLSPIVNRLQRAGLGNSLAVAVTAVFAFVTLGCTLTFIGHELSGLVSDLPQYKEELVSKARAFAGISAGVSEQFDDLALEVNDALEPSDATGDEPAAEQKDANITLVEPAAPKVESTQEPSLVSGIAQRFFPSSLSLSDDSLQDGQSPKRPIYVRAVESQKSLVSWAGTVGTVLGPLGTVGLVTVFVLFLLVYREDMRDRFIKAISHKDYVTTTEALNEVSRRISRYLLAQTVVNVSYGIVLGLGLYLIGLLLAEDGVFPNFMLWGMLATLLRFVPYAGPIVAAIFPILLSVAVFPGYTVPFAVVTLIVVLELTSNNLIEPLLYGASTGISAIAVILAAVFWGWMWGPVGLLLSTPLTVCLVVLGRHVPRFRIFSTLLSDQIDVAADIRFYQRLLSADAKKVETFLENQVSEIGSTATMDEVLVRGLKRIRHDQEEEFLSHKEAAKLRAIVADTVDAVSWGGDSGDETAVTDESEQRAERGEEDHESSGARRVNVVACAAQTADEELLLHVFAKTNADIDMQVISNAKLPDDVAAEAAELAPEVVLICVLPRGGFTQARYLCRALRDCGYKGLVLVCCCGKFRHFDKLFVKFRKAGANYMTTNWTQTASKLSSLIQKAPASSSSIADSRTASNKLLRVEAGHAKPERTPTQANDSSQPTVAPVVESDQPV